MVTIMESSSPKKGTFIFSEMSSTAQRGEKESFLMAPQLLRNFVKDCLDLPLIVHGVLVDITTVQVQIPSVAFHPRADTV